MTSLSEYLQAKRKLCEAATPGPWEPCLGSGNHEMTAIHFVGDEQNPFGLMVCDLIPDYMLEPMHTKDLEYKPGNMDFIADARTTMPKLLDALTRAISALEYHQQFKGLSGPSDIALADIERILEVKP
jgi:hypothetical protein